MLPIKNRIKYDIYQTLFQKEGVGNVYPDHIILLDTEPRECLGRTSRRDWRGDEVITLEYLQRCRRHHLEMKRRHSGGWTTIKGKPNKTISRAEKIIVSVIDKLQTVIANDQHDISSEVKIVSLEGNIGAGKSTLLTEVERRCKDRGIREIRILREPVDDWEKVTDGTKTILELFYENPAEYGFPLQILVGITTMTRTHKELLDYPDTKIILSERSTLSSRMVFARMLRNEGFLDDIEDRIYQLLFKGNEHKALVNPDMMMYIDTDPTTCLSRIGLRDRRGENRITLEELQKCESYHKTMFRETNIHVRSIDTDLEVNGEKLNWVDTIIGWCQQLSRGKEPNHLTSPVKENLGERDWWADWDGTETEDEQEQSGYKSQEMDVENLIEPLKRIKESQSKNQEELCLIKLKYGSLMYRFALPDWKLTNNRVIQEIERAWPELLDKEINLGWKLMGKDNKGKCEDRDLNESLDYIELINGKEVDQIMECEINLPPEENTNPTNSATCSGTGGTQL
jgi:deoxyadenosine/deoxycytidine kinase